MRPNTGKQLWREDRPAFGTWLASCSTFAAEPIGADPQFMLQGAVAALTIARS